MKPFADHFSGHAAQYAAHRPSYPPELVAAVASLVPAHDLAWDCGTGNGQAAVLLAAHFTQVIATDASREQLAQAPAHPRIAYRVALQDDSGAAPASVDLVTVAQALHWFDLRRFYGEANRVLKADGVLAVWCYDLPRVAPDIDPVVTWFYSQRIGRFWPPERRHVEAGYRDLEFPFEEMPSEVWPMTAWLTRQEFLGYVGTWSAVVKARLEEGADPLVELGPALAAVWPRPDERRQVTWPIRLRAGRRRATASP
jgi:SAM-dependent methyltransferase